MPNETNLTNMYKQVLSDIISIIGENDKTRELSTLLKQTNPEPNVQEFIQVLRSIIEEDESKNKFIFFDKKTEDKKLLINRCRVILKDAYRKKQMKPKLAIARIHHSIMIMLRMMFYWKF
jgi:hypothetical protein